MKTSLIPVFYSVAMAVSGTGSLVLGKLFDRFGVAVLIPLTLVSALSAPMVFLGGFWLALLGAAACVSAGCSEKTGRAPRCRA